MTRLKATHRGFGINPKIRRIAGLKVCAIRVYLFWVFKGYQKGQEPTELAADKSSKEKMVKTPKDDIRKYN